MQQDLIMCLIRPIEKVNEEFKNDINNLKSSSLVEPPKISTIVNY